MCFSATASFSTSVILVPIGIYCLLKSSGFKIPYWTFAVIPLIFGIQQFFEGLVWLVVGSGDGLTLHLAALGFLFFSHVFWLIWIPYACFLLENNAYKKKIFFILIFIGAAYGLSLYIPLLFNQNWLEVELIKQSIEYKTTLLYDKVIPKEMVSLIYALILLIPLLGISSRYIRIFGVIITASVIVTTLFMDYAFISIWCYFAAVLSFYILVLILKKDEVKVVNE